jgi:lipopolysaccharide export system protein LptA
LAAAFFSATVLMTVGSYAEDAPSGPSQNDADQKIQITSDSLITNNQANYAEFIGNVRATQGANIISADRIKIFFQKGTQSQDNPVAGQESITKIVAQGNVTINFDNKVAVAEQAVYITRTKVMVLSGANSKITSGNDSISGEKITFSRTDGRINVEGSTEKRVNAVFFPGKNGLN